jgi:glycosyltransferase involved in cell wall biosynthesis
VRIGVNALYLIPGGVGGTEIYLRNLLAGLAQIDGANEYVIFTNHETGADLVPTRPNFKWVPLPVAARFRPLRIVWEQTGLPWAARKHGVRVLLNPGFTCPVWSGCPNVTVFHDLQHKRHPEYFRWFDLPFWRLLLWAAARRSRTLIAVSEATRQDLRKYYGVDSVVIHHGVEEEFFEIAERRAPQDYILCVSTLHPHKNLERLIRVHGETAGLPRLVITGLRGFAADQLEKLAGGNVRFTGWVPREELYELYRGARAFVYPSTFEGFGMPVLEAMAAAVPVACSDISPLREVADGCALFFDPNDDEKLRNALRCLLDGTSLVEAGRRRAREFSWTAAARATLRLLTGDGII